MKRCFWGLLLLQALSFAGSPALLSPPANVPPAQSEYSHRIWRIEDGLPENRIEAISQTPDGYLWLGTGEGLVRFDGVRFTVFDRSNTPALSDSGILALSLSSDGTLWIGMNGGGLASYRAGVFRSYGPREGLTNGFVRAIFEDSRGNLWIGTYRGFFRRDGDRFERLDNTAEVPLATVPSIAEDETGRLRAVSPVGLLTIGNGKLVRSPGNCDTTRFRSLTPLGKGLVWVAENTGGGLLKNGCVERDPGLAGIPMRVAVRDSNGNVWVGTEGHGLFRVSGGRHGSRLIPFAGSDSVLPGKTIEAIFEDREHNLWVGCEDGLLRLSRSLVTNIGAAQGLKDADVLTASVTRSGELWLATVTGKLYSVANGRVQPRRLPGSAADLSIRNVFEDRSGALWFGTSGAGVVRVKGSTATVYSRQAGLASNSVRQIAEDHAGNLWLALASGVSRWNGSSFRNYQPEDGISYSSTRCLLVDSRGDVLVGTDAGLNRIHNGDIVRDGEFAALAHEPIWSIHEDSAGTLWLGTRGDGLLRFRSGKVTRFSRENGLISNTVFAILEDKAGNLWMSTSAGVVSAARRELDAAGGPDGDSVAPYRVNPYGTADGMTTSQMNGGVQPAGSITASGDLWFAGVKGVVHIRPESIADRSAQDRRAPPVLIEKLVADSKAFPLEKTVRIPPGHGRLQIDFTLCDLLSPQRVSFRYRLDGVDENWISALRTRSASYTNVPPGNYTFHVIATETGSPSIESEALLTFRLEPAFYQTTWFLAVLALAGSAAVWGSFAFFARQTRARYSLLLAERTRLAREMHDTVIQGCVGVSTLLEASAGFRSVDEAEAEKLIDQARIQVAQTLEEARDAVWDLRNPQPPESEVAVLFDLAGKLAAEHRITIETRTDGGGSIDRELGRTILFVGREALGNAIKHARPARIGIRVSYTPFDVSLEVTDDGLGFDAQSDDSPGSRHFGLIGMRERVEAAGGSFRIESKPGAGTRVMATMPTTQRFHAGLP
jgi:ligand-binding sensor domain-containing protein/signal transduction histidine kinase